MEQRDVVAPAARGERVERRPRLGHARRPQRTVQPPRLRRCACTSSKPASRMAVEQPRHGPALVEVADAAAEEAPDLVPARARSRDRRAAGRRRPRGPRRPAAPRPAARRSRAAQPSRPAAALARARAGPPAGRRDSGAGRRRSGRRRSASSKGSSSAEASTSRTRSVSAASASRRRASASISRALVDADDRAALLPDELERDGRRCRRRRRARCRPGRPARRETRKRRQRGSWPNESRFA